jgi:hypothetical protein
MYGKIETYPEKVRKIKNTKAKGSRNEYKVIKFFLENGAVGYCKAGGSLGVFDSVILFPSCCVLVQTKSNNWPQGLEEDALFTHQNRLLDYVVIGARVNDRCSGLKPIIFRWYGGKTPQGYQTAIDMYPSDLIAWINNGRKGQPNAMSNL